MKNRGATTKVAFFIFPIKRENIDEFVKNDDGLKYPRINALS
jgi:hypothetical protein